MGMLLGILSEESFSDRTTETGGGLVAARELEEEKSGVTVFPDGSAGKESACNAGDTEDVTLIPGSGRFPWIRKCQPTPVFLPEKLHGQRSLEGYTSQGHRVT